MERRHRAQETSRQQEARDLHMGTSVPPATSNDDKDRKRDSSKAMDNQATVCAQSMLL